MLATVEDILHVAPKLTNTKPVVNFAKYLVDRQFWKRRSAPRAE